MLLGNLWTYTYAANCKKLAPIVKCIKLSFSSLKIFFPSLDDCKIHSGFIGETVITQKKMLCKVLSNFLSSIQNFHIRYYLNSFLAVFKNVFLPVFWLHKGTTNLALLENLNLVINSWSSSRPFLNNTLILFLTQTWSSRSKLKVIPPFKFFFSSSRTLNLHVENLEIEKKIVWN